MKIAVVGAAGGQRAVDRVPPDFLRRAWRGRRSERRRGRLVEGGPDAVAEGRVGRHLREVVEVRLEGGNGQLLCGPALHVEGDEFAHDRRN